MTCRRCFYNVVYFLFEVVDPVFTVVEIINMDVVDTSTSEMVNVSSGLTHRCSLSYDIMINMFNLLCLNSGDNNHIHQLFKFFNRKLNPVR